MAQFGRFTIGNEQPDEIYEGDSMKLEKGYVNIFIGDHAFDLLAKLVAVIRLDKGQSVRRISVECRDVPFLHSPSD
jgi:hypothetical protein